MSQTYVTDGSGYCDDSQTSSCIRLGLEPGLPCPATNAPQHHLTLWRTKSCMSAMQPQVTFMSMQDHWSMNVYAYGDSKVKGFITVSAHAYCE